MALVTTFMTGPALDLINYLFPEQDTASAQPGSKLFKILISFGPPIKGKKLLRLADQLTHKKIEEADITAFHLTPSADINPKEAKEYEHESFRLVKHEAQSLGIRIKTVYRATNDINKEVTREANKGRYDLLLVGGSHSLFSDDVVGGKVKNFLEDTSGHVGVLVDKDFEIADRILLILQEFNDLFLLSFAERFIQNNNARLMVYDPNRLLKTNMIFSMALDKISTENNQKIQVHEHRQALTRELVTDYNLVMVSYSGWKDLSRKKNDGLAQSPSVLILKPQRA
jgi:hypothetical protein